MSPKHPNKFTPDSAEAYDYHGLEFEIQTAEGISKDGSLAACDKGGAQIIDPLQLSRNDGLRRNVPRRTREVYSEPSSRHLGQRQRSKNHDQRAKQA